MGRYPIAEILALVRAAPDATTGWERLLALCRHHWRSPHWAELRGIKPAQDATAAAKWLRQQLAGSRRAGVAVRGLYLGLDTLNMEGPEGTNLEIGGTSHTEPDHSGPEAENIEWVHRLEWYGERHLIAGLRAMKRVYAREEWGALSEPADYVLFLGYSGVVLAEAAAAVGWPRRATLVWGFHDGDLFRLGHGHRGGFERAVAAGVYSAEYLDAERKKADLIIDDFQRRHPELFR